MALQSNAQERITTITYIANELIYIGAGSGEGITKNDTLPIFRKENLIGKVVVANVSRKSSSGKFILILEEPKIGDKVDLTSVQKVVKVEKDIPKTGKVESLPELTLVEKKTKERKIRTRFRGRYLIQFLDNRNLDESDYTNQRLTNSLKFSVQNAIFPFLEFNVYLNHSYQMRKATLGENENNYNIYQTELNYKNPNSPYFFSIGRTYSRGTTSAGNLNGGEFGYKVSENLETGIYAGRESGIVGNELFGNGNKFGAFVRFEKGEFTGNRIRTTFSFNQKNVAGKVDEQYLATQNFMNFGTKFFLNQSLDLYLKNNDESKVQIRRAFFSTNYKMQKNLNLSASYNAYKNIQFDETADIPDSLFNDKFSHSVSLRSNYNSAKNYSIFLGANTRFSQGISQPVIGGNFGVSFKDILQFDYVRTRVNYYNTSNSSSFRTSLVLEKDLFTNFTTSFEYGNYFYISNGQSSELNNYFALGLGYYFNSKFYSDLNVEYDFGETNDYLQSFLVIGILF